LNIEDRTNLAFLLEDLSDLESIFCIVAMTFGLMVLWITVVWCLWCYGL